MQQESMTSRTAPAGQSAARKAGHRGAGKLSWPYVLGGGALVLAATRGGLLRGIALTGAGGAAIYRGVKGQWPVVESAPADTSVRATLTINRPAEELYDLWRDLESFESLVPSVEKVAAHGGKSHWEASLPVGGTVQWDAEIVHEERPRRIEWRSTADSSIPMHGSVRFNEPPGNRGTEVRVEMRFDPPGGKLGAKLASALSLLPEQQLRHDLKNLKRRLEAGEIPTVDGQPHGNRNPFASLNDGGDR